MIGAVNALYYFLEASAKRYSKFEAVQKAINTAKPPTTLKPGGFRAVHARKNLYDACSKGFARHRTRRWQSWG